MLPRLKSLELHGYKTFANRTLFEFPGVITAIVGPNGSGKSNIADAIRWVLGEQSYSLLRGRKTEDMIFAGSEQRPRAGMASATITFDNSDGWLPIDYSEVSITRRAYRDGQNEYLLNGQRVRLREISELLAQSGLAERTYTIIGQGLVDAALALKPEERRRLFEEAAGIGLYRSRREESLNRLETTRRNLDRVQDIMAEIEPRLQSLERQARRAQDYERIKADLRLLLRDWYGYHWHRTQEEAAHALDVLRVQEEKLAHAREKLESASRQLSEARARIQELREQLSAWHGESSQLHTRREGLSRELAILDERQRALADQAQSWQADRARLEEEIRLQEERVQAAAADRERLAAELAEAQEQAGGAGEALKARQTERARVSELLNQARREQIAAETRLVQLKARQEELAARSAEQRRALEGARQAVEVLEADLTGAGERLAAAQQAHAAREEESQAAAEGLRRQREAIAASEAEGRKLSEAISRAQADAARLRAQVKVLEEAEKSLSGYAEGVRYLMQAAAQGRLKGVVRTLSSQIEVPSEYEGAISAALGDYLEGLVLEEQADPEAALELLQDAAGGRAALLPREWIRPAGGKDLPGGEGVIGPAAGLVTCDAAIRPVMDALLGGVVVVRDRATARRVFSKLAPGGRAVTLVGEVFTAAGAVLGGRPAKAGALSRPRELKALQAALAQAERDLKAAQAAGEANREEGSRLREELKALEAAARQATGAVDIAARAQQQAALAQEQARRQLEWQKSQLATLEAQIGKADAERERAAEEIRDTEARNAELVQQVRTQQAALAGLPVEEVQSQAAHWQARVEFAARAAQDAGARLEERRQAVARSREQLAELERRIADAAAVQAQAEAGKSAHRGDETALLEQIEALQKQIEPAESEMRSAEADYDRMQKDEEAHRQALNVAERYTAQSQLEYSRQRDALDSLRRRVEEDFGLVAFEYEAEIAGQTPLPLEGMVEQLPAVKKLPTDLEDSIARQRAQLRRMGAINPEAKNEYESVLERYEFLTAQMSDLRKADEDLRQVINELDELMRKEFKRTFDAVAIEFRGMFSRLFAGGNAHLVLIDAETPTEAGIEIEARLPGRREQGLSLLSGGERSLTAVALVFALLKVSPTPFCVMDEVDAMLDESNVGRFRELLRELSQETQFIVITHNRNTVQAADVIYGVTMGRDSSSQIISLRLDDVTEELVT